MLEVDGGLLWVWFGPVLVVGLYWWFARGRLLGFVYCWAATLGTASLVGLLFPDSERSLRAAVSLLATLPVSIAMLYLGTRLSPKGSKVCPACAEHVKRKATACKHCGHTFQPGEGMEQKSATHRIWPQW
ncbi:zinc ribbon domain-containing protein [Anaeromyxobacter paludicola]|uniref:zinc ribbon domain-containing protein n=1 Tax=Anaeromyxobacter paludicola TaxID=2918171 RepID=UPI0020BFF6A6|nr:zinc ribbon domain-containing protein [Anaeromyxobacter paludicola]